MVRHGPRLHCRAVFPRRLPRQRPSLGLDFLQKYGGVSTVSIVQEPSEREPGSKESVGRASTTAQVALRRAARSARVGWARSRPLRQTWRRRVYEILELRARRRSRQQALRHVSVDADPAQHRGVRAPKRCPRSPSSIMPPSMHSRSSRWRSSRIEYGLRIWTAVEVPFLSRLNPWAARLRFAGRPSLIIDFRPSRRSILGISHRPRPARAPGAEAACASSSCHVTRRPCTRCIRVLVNERRALIGAGLAADDGGAVRLHRNLLTWKARHSRIEFGSVPQSAWWAIATLTTVGYGDVTPVTALGRSFGAVVMVVGLCILASAGRDHRRRLLAGSEPPRLRRDVVARCRASRCSPSSTPATWSRSCRCCTPTTCRRISRCWRKAAKASPCISLPRER